MGRPVSVERRNLLRNWLQNLSETQDAIENLVAPGLSESGFYERIPELDQPLRPGDRTEGEIAHCRLVIFLDAQAFGN